MSSARSNSGAPAADFHVVVLGLNHVTAPVSLRERAHFTRSDVKKLTGLLLQNPEYFETVVLSTCNRSEIYVATAKPDEAESLLQQLWSRYKNIQASELQAHSYSCSHSNAVSHLFRVVSSLDSMVVGENQILGQVKEAYQAACEYNGVDFYFNYLFQTAFRVGKRVRSETKLNEGAVSISYAAVELAKKVLGQRLIGKVVGVVGSGEMGELTAFHLDKSGVTDYIFFNRSVHNAERLAARFGGEIFRLSGLETELWRCDIVVSSTAAIEPVILKSQVQKAVKKRAGKPMFLIDIAVPRDIEESVASLGNTFLFCIDDLKKVVGENQSFRQEAAKKALSIIDEETAKVEDWYQTLELGGTIKKLQDYYQALAKKEIGKIKEKLPQDVHPDFEKFSRTLLGKFLHRPITGLKLLGQKTGGRKASRYAEEIFRLDEP